MSNRLGMRTRALVTAGTLAAAAAGGVVTAGVAQAAVTPHSLSCNWGYNNANTAWFTCSGSGTWQGWVNCYYWPGQQTSWITQNGGTVHEWLTCSSPSHVTGGGFHY